MVVRRRRRCLRRAVLLSSGSRMGADQHDRCRKAAARKRAARPIERVVRASLRVMHHSPQVQYNLHLPEELEPQLREVLRRPRPSRKREVQSADVAHDRRGSLGSQWFEVDRKIAIHIVKDTMYYSAFSEFCRPPCYLDEHHIPTLLHIEKQSQIARRSATFTDWSRGGAHPATFGEGDVSEEFLRMIHGEQDCLHSDQTYALFARKFVPNALKSLQGLAPAVLGF